MFWEWPLDNTLRDREIRYYMADGSACSSRDIYWRALVWENVVKIEMTIRKQSYRVLPGPGHLGFITYRTSALEWSQKKHTRYNRDTWLIGYLDATHAHMTEVYFKTGALKGHLVKPIKEIETHIHPRLKQQWARGWNPIVKAREQKHAIKVMGSL